MSDLPTSVHRTRAEQSSTWERQFTPKQIYAGMGLAHLAIILTGVYRLLTVRGAEWRLIIIVVIGRPDAVRPDRAHDRRHAAHDLCG